MAVTDDWDEPEEYFPAEWATMLETAEAIAALAGRYREAKLELLELIADGRLDLRHREIWQEVTSVAPAAGGQTIRGTQSERPFRFYCRKREAPALAPKGFWLRSDGWVVDLARIDWGKGTLIGTCAARVDDRGVARPAMRRGATGVLIKLGSVPMLPAGLTSGTSKQTNGIRGRNGPRQRKFNLAPVLAELECQIDTREIVRLGGVHDYGMQAKLEKEIVRLLNVRQPYDAEITAITEEGPSESTLRRKAKEIHSTWKAVAARREPV